MKLHIDILFCVALALCLVNVTPHQGDGCVHDEETTTEAQNPEPPVTEPACKTKADIIFVLDSSSSIPLVDYMKMLQFAAHIAKSFVIGPDDVRFGAVVFSYYANKVFDLKDKGSSEELSKALLLAPYLNSSTNTHRAFDLINYNEMFSTKAGGRKDAKDIAILLTDGNSNRQSKTLNSVQRLKTKGVTVMTIGIGREISGDELRLLASGPEVVFDVANFDALKKIEAQVTEQTCKVIPPTPPYPNDPPVETTLADDEGTATMPPPEVTEGERCHALADIIFILDSSGSIKITDYVKLLQFAAGITYRFYVGNDDVRFGAVIFSYYAEKLFDLKDYDDHTLISNALLGARHLNSSTNTHRALNLIKYDDMFSAESGGRDTATDVVVIVTDGNSNRRSKTIKSADQLKAAGVKIISVGVGDEISQDELKALASSEDDIFTAENFDILDHIKNNVATRVCEEIAGDEGSTTESPISGSGGTTQPTEVTTQISEPVCEIEVEIRESISEDQYCECIAAGDPHYLNSNGQRIEFQGPCEYYLAITTIELGECGFKISLQNEYRYNWVTVTWIKQVNIWMFGAKFSLLKHNGLLINDERYFPPVNFNSGAVMVNTNLRTITLETKYGVRVVMTNNFKVTIYIPKAYAGKMNGMCGTCQSKDETYVLRNGTDVSDLPNRDDLLGVSWAIEEWHVGLNERCKDDVSPPDFECPLNFLLAAKEKCNILADTSGPFKDCIKAMGNEAQFFFVSCTTDYCAGYVNELEALGTLCDSVEVFAEACRDLDILVKWRTPDFCPIDCGANSHYSDMVPACLPSCVNPKPNGVCTQELSSGCMCNKGYLLSGDECVSPKDCGCYDEEKNYFPVNKTVIESDCTKSISCEYSAAKTLPELVVRELGPCDDNAVCIIEDGERMCVCNEGYTGDGRTCEEDVTTTETPVEPPACITKADIIFVLDASSSIPYSDYMVSLQFAASVVKKFKVGPNDVRFGALVFSSYVEKLFDLKNFTDKDELSKAILLAPHIKSSTATHRAFDYIRYKKMFSEAAGGREDAKDVIILLTDGNSNRQSKTLKSVRTLKSDGAVVIGIGVGDKLNPDELELIVSDSTKDLFYAKDFEALAEIESNLIERTCEVPKATPPFPSPPSEGTTPDPNAPTLPPAPMTPKPACRHMADIVFVLDSSGSIQIQDYIEMLTFAADITENFVIGNADVRFGAVIFSYDGEKLFDLKDYGSHKDLSQALLDARHLNSSTNTHRGLNVVIHEKMFSTGAGGRPDAKDIVIVMTDGNSARPRRTVKAAKALKDQGVRILTIGVGVNISNVELKLIASSNDDVFFTDSYEVLDRIENDVATRICVTKKPEPKPPTPATTEEPKLGSPPTPEPPTPEPPTPEPPTAAPEPPTPEPPTPEPPTPEPPTPEPTTPEPPTPEPTTTTPEPTTTTPEPTTTTPEPTTTTPEPTTTTPEPTTTTPEPTTTTPEPTTTTPEPTTTTPEPTTTTPEPTTTTPEPTTTTPEPTTTTPEPTTTTPEPTTTTPEPTTTTPEPTTTTPEPTTTTPEPTTTTPEPTTTTPEPTTTTPEPTTTTPEPTTPEPTTPEPTTEEEIITQEMTTPKPPTQPPPTTTEEPLLGSPPTEKPQPTQRPTRSPTPSTTEAPPTTETTPESTTEVTKNPDQKGECTIATRIQDSISHDEYCECTASGDPHYISTEGYPLHFQGPCEYYLSLTTEHLGECGFKISLQNEYRHNWVTVTWIKRVNIWIFGTKYSFLKDNELLVDEVERFPPLDIENGMVTINVNLQTITLETKFGLKVTMSRNNIVKLIIPKAYAGLMNGICGTCQRTEKERYLLRNGTDVSSNPKKASLVGTSWAIEHWHPGLPGRCQESFAPPEFVCPSDFLKIAKEKCKIMVNKNGPFKQCIEKMGQDSQFYYVSCTEDYCAGHKDHGKAHAAMCDAVDAFADVCRDYGVEVSWRSAKLCPATCPTNSHYSQNLAACPPTCVNPKPRGRCSRKKESGCMCDTGYLLSGNKCVRSKDCGCFDRQKNYFPYNRTVVSKNCRRSVSCVYSEKRKIPMLLTRRLTPCDRNAQCLLEDGKRQCVCKTGYTGNGFSCQAKLSSNPCFNWVKLLQCLLSKWQKSKPSSTKYKYLKLLLVYLKKKDITKVRLYMSKIWGSTGEKELEKMISTTAVKKPGSIDESGKVDLSKVYKTFITYRYSKTVSSSTISRLIYVRSGSHSSSSSSSSGNNGSRQALLDYYKKLMAQKGTSSASTASQQALIDRYKKLMAQNGTSSASTSSRWYAVIKDGKITYVKKSSG